MGFIKMITLIFLLLRVVMLLSIKARSSRLLLKDILKESYGGWQLATKLIHLLLEVMILQLEFGVSGTRDRSLVLIMKIREE